MEAHERLFPLLAGNRRLKEKMLPAITSEPPAVSHAYIIEGPSGSGKLTLAKSIAASLVCEKRGDPDSPLPCGHCLACRKLFEGLSPDLSVIDCDESKKSIGVDQIRDLRRDVHIYPSELDYKFYIVKGADTMTAQAQNAFLLTLEEPPAYAVIMLLCENSSLLLETVRSRAQKLRTTPLDYEENLRTVLKISPAAAMKQRQNPAVFEAAVVASHGCPGRAIELISSEEGVKIAERREKVENFITLAADRRRGSEAMNSLFAYAGASRDNAAAFLSDLITAVRDLLVLKKSEEAPLLFFPDRESAIEKSDAVPIKRLLALSDAAEKAAAAIERYMNVRLTLMAMLSQAGII